MACAQMRHLFWRFWWADRHRFVFPGLYFCAFGCNNRILPVPRYDPKHWLD
jgi:hypothetical protein